MINTKHFQCDHCENSFLKERHLRKHVKKSHFRLSKTDSSNIEEPMSFDCEMCDEKFEKRRHLKEHIGNIHDVSSEEAMGKENEQTSVDSESDTIVKSEPLIEDDDEFKLIEDNVTVQMFDDQVVINDETFKLLEQAVEKENKKEQSSKNQHHKLIKDEKVDEAFISLEEAAKKEDKQKPSPSKKQKRVVKQEIADEAFEVVESVETEDEEKPSPRKKQKKLFKVEDKDSSRPRSRRSTRTPISYNEDSNDGDFLKFKKNEKVVKTKPVVDLSKSRRLVRKKLNKKSRKVSRCPVNYNELSDDDDNNDDSSKIASRRSKRRSNRNCFSKSYNEDSDDDNMITIERSNRRRHKNKDGEADIVIDGEAITENYTLPESNSHHFVDEEDILETVEITPMTIPSVKSAKRKIVKETKLKSKTKSINSGYIPNTRTKISVIDETEEKRLVVKKGKIVRVKCKHCHLDFFNLRQMEAHAKKHDEKGESTSNNKYEDLNKIKKKTNQEASFLRCTFKKCNVKLSSQDDLGKHKEDAHFHKCTKCAGTIIFESKLAFESHNSKHHVNPCNECFEIYDTKEKLLRHKASKHPHCDVCEDEFSWPSPGHSCYLTKSKLKP